ncbi:hypothetical protein FQR65_LT18549 [Abscondita terminalis]|nr:hypothetical protein FQR65_LT18549 [Abscondita terminalis]
MKVWVKSLENSYAEKIVYRYTEFEKLDWMTPETKKKAIEKLEAFTKKIGYPDKWKNIQDVRDQAKDTYYANLKSAERHAYKGNDDAINYGAIGAVIGHEIHMLMMIREWPVYCMACLVKALAATAPKTYVAKTAQKPVVSGDATQQNGQESLGKIEFEETAFDFGQVKLRYSFRSECILWLLTNKTALYYSKSPVLPGKKGEVKVAFDSKGQAGIQYAESPDNKAFHPLQSDTDTANIQVDLSGLKNRNWIVFSNQIGFINRQFPNVNRWTQRKVPIKAAYSVIFAKQYAPSGKDVSKIEFWETDTIRGTGINADIRTMAYLDRNQKANINVYPAYAEVTIPVGELTEKVMELPIKVENAEKYTSVRTLPTKVKRDFEAVVDTEDWEENRVPNLPVIITKKPPYCKSGRRPEKTKQTRDQPICDIGLQEGIGAVRRPEGYYCRYGDFYIDALEPVRVDVVSHAHADHATKGHAQIIATEARVAFMQFRYSKQPLNTFLVKRFLKKSFNIAEVV